MTHNPQSTRTMTGRPGRMVFVAASLAVSCVLVAWMYAGGKGVVEPMPPVTDVRGERLDAAPAPGGGAEESVEAAGAGEAVEAAEPNAPADFKSRKPGPGGNILITLDELGDFDYSPPLVQTEAEDSATSPRIPARFQELDGMHVATYGYMIPIGLNEGRVREFILVSNILACCFGVMPALNEWVYVTVEGEAVDYRVNEPVLAGGVLEVGEEWREGMVVSLYRLRAATVRPLGPG